jgi:hypothetical protein
VLLPTGHARAESDYVPCNDIPALKRAIAEANADGGSITLTSGCTYALTAVDNPADGLPEITGDVRISSLGATVRRSSAAPFRILHVREGGSLTLNGITVSGGRASEGGGIRNEGTLTLNATTVSGNRADLYGGGVRNQGTMRMQRGAVRDNTAGQWGGGVSNAGGDATFNAASIIGNESGSDSGGIDNAGLGARSSALRLNTTTVSGNRALSGGALGNFHTSTATAVGSSITANTADNGGGIVQAGGRVRLVAATVTGNTAHFYGGGIYRNPYTSSPVHLVAADVTENKPDNCSPEGTVPQCPGGSDLQGPKMQFSRTPPRLDRPLSPAPEPRIP